MKKQIFISIIFSYVLLFIVWFAYTLYGIPYLRNSFGTEKLEVLNGIIKCIVWILPAYSWIFRFDNHLWLQQNKLFQKSNTYFFYLFALLFIFMGFYKQYQFQIPFKFPQWYQWIGLFLIVGITEEMMFRGWIMNGFLSILKSSYLPNIFQSLLFVGIHIPIWLLTGQSQNLLYSSVFVFLMGLFFGWIFYTTKSLRCSIILHMIYDGTILLFGLNGIV